jgi:hypothetical protein
MLMAFYLWHHKRHTSQVTNSQKRSITLHKLHYIVKYITLVWQQHIVVSNATYKKTPLGLLNSITTCMNTIAFALDATKHHRIYLSSYFTPSIKHEMNPNQNLKAKQWPGHKVICFFLISRIQILKSLHGPSHAI